MSNDGIFERPDSQFWWASWSDSSGKTHRRSTRIRKLDDPNKVQAFKFRTQFILGEDREPEGETWASLLEQYLEHLEGRIERTTMVRYEMALKHLFPVFGSCDARMSGKEIKAYLRDRMKLAKPATINKEIALMLGMYRFARQELEWDITNPWEGRTLPLNNERDRWLTQEEIQRLTANACPHVADFIQLVVNTGLRPGEALNLKWERVDLDQGIIRFQKRVKQNQDGTQKSGKAAGIPLNSQARLALASRKEAAVKNRTVSPWVFCSSNGLQIKSVKTGFASACKRAGLENVKPHDLRRTFASLLVQSGVSIQAVSNLLRHSNINITDKVYAHLSVEHLREATRVLETPPKLKVVS